MENPMALGLKQLNLHEPYWQDVEGKQKKKP
jgi:hypothetical protein